jgi:hypothetical protein
MKNLLGGAVAAAAIAAACPAFAQSSPNWTKGKVPTAGEWNAAFAAKQDALGYVPLNVAGGVLTGRLVTAPPDAATAGFNLSPGTTPANPANGDMWATSNGLFARINGVTVGPLSGPSGASFNAIAPLNLTFPNSVVTYGLNINSTLTVMGGNLGLNLPNPNTWSGLQTFSAGVSIASAFSATGLVKNSDLVNAATTVNGQTCTLGGACTINASATLITVGATQVTGGVSTRVLFDSAGLLGEYAISGSGSVAMTNAPTFVTPVLGAAAGTSLALGSCTIGTNAICTNGTEELRSTSSVALAVGANGATNPVLRIDTSVASAADGLAIIGTASGSGVALAVISPATNSQMTINTKGTGGLFLQNAAAGPITLSTATSINGALTYGGVTLANSVTGTGSMVLGTSPSISSLTVTTAFNAAGLVTYADVAAAAIANASQYFSGASNVLVPANVIYQAETTTTFGSTTTFDFSTFINTAVTLTGNITTMTLGNVKAGQAGTIAFIQDATGSRTTVWNSIFKFTGGATPTLSAAPNAVDVLSYACRSATFCVASLLNNVR